MRAAQRQGAERLLPLPLRRRTCRNRLQRDAVVAPKNTCAARQQCPNCLLAWRLLAPQGSGHCRFSQEIPAISHLKRQGARRAASGGQLSVRRRGAARVHAGLSRWSKLVALPLRVCPAQSRQTADDHYFGCAVSICVRCLEWFCARGDGSCCSVARLITPAAGLQQVGSRHVSCSLQSRVMVDSCYRMCARHERGPSRSVG